MTATSSPQFNGSGDGQTSLNHFLDAVPSLDAFRDGVDDSRYIPIPDDWHVGTADVIGSTQAIENGGYKTVNMVGAGVIAAAMNALGTRDFPFVFGGDGATFVVPPEFDEPARQALSAMRRWTTDETDLRLRAALVPVAAIRNAGFDVRVARFVPNENVSYAMFSGGGLAWAEREMKAGRYDVPRAPEGVRPDLEGLSCRWHPAEAQRGEIVSLIVQPLPGVSGDVFQTLVANLLETLRAMDEQGGHPVTGENLRFAAFPTGLNLEARAAYAPAGRGLKRLKLRCFALFAWVLFQFNLKSGAFDPELYRDDLRANSDFRKFDDGLKLTVDCPAETIEQLETFLKDALACGTAVYGLHRQRSALMTCIVPSSTTRDHIHFVDGGDGGYARAAEMMKSRLREHDNGQTLPPSEDRRQHND